MTPVTEIATSARRPPHVIRGDGLVRLKKPVWFEGEMVRPGERFVPDHRLVCAHPELFDAAYSRDRKVLVELSRMIENKIRAHTSYTRDRPSWRLAATPDKSWHLR